MVISHHRDGLTVSKEPLFQAMWTRKTSSDKQQKGQKGKKRRCSSAPAKLGHNRNLPHFNYSQWWKTTVLLSWLVGWLIDRLGFNGMEATKKRIGEKACSGRKDWECDGDSVYLPKQRLVRACKPYLADCMGKMWGNFGALSFAISVKKWIYWYTCSRSEKVGHGSFFWVIPDPTLNVGTNILLTRIDAGIEAVTSDDEGCIRFSSLVSGSIEPPFCPRNSFQLFHRFLYCQCLL